MSRNTDHFQRLTIDEVPLKSSIVESGDRYFLAHLKPDVNDYQLVRNGWETVRKLNQELVIIKKEKALPHLNPQLFAKIWTVNSLWKLSDNVLEAKTGGKYIWYLKSDQMEATKAVIRNNKEIAIINQVHNSITIEATLKQIIDILLNRDEVIYLGLEGQQPKVESSVSDLNLNPNSINRIHSSAPNLLGQGMILSIQEQSYDTEDIDLAGRHVPSSSQASVSSNHATDMATIAAGAGNSFIKGMGVARQAGITSSDFTDVLPDPDNYFKDLGITVQNHSYGTEIESFYGFLAESYDKSAHRIPTLLHIFSSGNQGTEAPNSGIYQALKGYANLTGNYKLAKNVLTVGSVGAIGQEMEQSSRGPAHDGRIKPEVVAYSTVGSSNSSALVSGLAILLQQEYLQMHATTAESALIKAVIINSAKDVGTEGPDFVTGFGNVNGFRAWETIDQARHFTGSIQGSASNKFFLEVPDNAKNLKVTLCWNDLPATANTNLALINDLDIVLSHNDTSWFPWILNTDGDKEKLAEPARTGIDRINNIEQIAVKDPTPGRYEISVTGRSVQSGNQVYYVAYQWDMEDQFTWTFPTSSDNIPFDGESETYFRWESTLSEATGELALSLDNGQNWEVISNHIDLGLGYFNWQAPEFTGIALGRMMVAGKPYFSDTFTISRPPEIEVGFNCSDSILIQWHKIEYASTYQVLGYTGESMAPIISTDDTLVVLYKDKLSSALLAMQPVLENGRRAMRSYTFDYNQQGVSCYLVSFFSELSNDVGVALNLELGTTYAVDQISFERESDNGFIRIGNIERPASDTVRFLDSEPFEGLNRYRARIFLSNGEEIVSEISQIYYIDKVGFSVFPNPIARGERINVFSKEGLGEVILRLYAPDGKLIFNQTITSDRESFPLPELSGSWYLYKISSSEFVLSGKLLLAP